ncbi:MAG TPA: hypothetical protein VM434_05030 [Beijerinckiaceae bacterium]|nr:hypothetical protein [Beijerinckiaceae bacterium]
MEKVTDLILAELRGMRGELGGLAREVVEVRERQVASREAADARHRNAVKSFDGITARLDSGGRRFDELTAALAKDIRDHAELARDHAALAGRVQDLDGRVEGLDGKVDGLAAAVAEHKRAGAVLALKVGGAAGTGGAGLGALLFSDNGVVWTWIKLLGRKMGWWA